MQSWTIKEKPCWPPGGLWESTALASSAYLDQSAFKWTFISRQPCVDSSEPSSHICLIYIPISQERGAEGVSVFFPFNRAEKIHWCVFFVIVILIEMKIFSPQKQVRAVIILQTFVMNVLFLFCSTCYIKYGSYEIRYDQMFLRMLCLLHTEHSWASCIPGSTRSPQTYSISLDYRPAKVRAPIKELHCYVQCQIRSQWEGTELVLACVSGWGSDWTHSCTVRVLQNPGPELSPDRCCIKTALKTLSLAQGWSPHAGAYGMALPWHDVKPSADLWPKHKPAKHQASRSRLEKRIFCWVAEMNFWLNPLRNFICETKSQLQVLSLISKTWKDDFLPIKNLTFYMHLFTVSFIQTPIWNNKAAPHFQNEKNNKEEFSCPLRKFCLCS